MMKNVILLVFMLLGIISFGQGPSIDLKPKVGNEDTGKSMGGAKIEVYKNGTLYTSETTSSNGKTQPINLPICEDCFYTVKIKRDGFVTKTFVIDARNDYPEELEPGAVPQPFEVDLFASVDGIDFSFLEKEPMVEFALDSYGMLDFDKQKIKTMQKKIADLKKKMEERKEELEKEEEEKAKREADFMAYVKAGDNAMGQKDYEKAIGQYELALDIKADHAETKAKLQTAREKLEELNASAQLDKDFSAKMTAGKAAYEAGELQKALTLYKEASKIKPAEAQPIKLIKEIEAKLAAEKENEAAFKQLVADGDGAAGTKDYQNAIDKYTAALKLKKDPAVQTKIDNVNKLLAEQAAAENEAKAEQEKYDKFVAAADAAFDTGKYDEAKTNYQEALKIKAGEARPTSQLAEIEKILKEQEADKAAKEKAEADYQAALANAKEKFDAREWPEAKAGYEAVLKLKPNDKTALDQIDLIRKEIEKDALSAKRNEEYDAFMNEAKVLFDDGKLKEAKSKYNAASGVKSDEQAPKDKIAEIEKLLADQANAAAKEEEYTKYMTQGDGANDSKSFTEALSFYKKALDTKPGDAAAQGKIDAINKVLEEEKSLAEEEAKFNGFVADATEAFNAKNYDKAKLNYNKALEIKEDAAIRKKIEEIDALIAANQNEAETQAKFDAAITEADKLYDQVDFKAALAKYEEANSIKADDYPKTRISELKEKIAAQEAAADKEEQFNDLVSEADAAYAAEDYTKALAKYKEAIAVKPDPTINSKIAEIDVLLASQGQAAEKKANYDKKVAEAEVAYKAENWTAATSLYKAAKLIKADETYPDEQLAKIELLKADASAAAAEKEYQAIVKEADVLFDANKLDEALTVYNRALGVRTDDAHVIDRIAEIAKIKRDAEDAETAARKLEENYNAAIKEGERAADAKNWTLGLEKFKEALDLKAGDAYALNKIAEMETNMGDAASAAAKKAEYEKLKGEADALFNTQDYAGAIDKYNAALKVMPDEQYPKDKITSAENFIRLAGENDKDATYKKLLANAQEKLDANNYEDALALYLEAKTTKPSDPLPQQRIDEINQTIASMAGDQKKEQEYKDFVKEADYQFEKGNWKEARDSYNLALGVFDRQYPKDKIALCEEGMKAATSNTEDKQYNKIIAAGDKYLKKANYEKAAGYYKRALKLKPTDQYPKDKLAEIDELLNPSSTAGAKSTTNLKDYGDPNRSTNAVDVETMLADAEAQRKYQTVLDAEEQRIVAETIDSDNDSSQTDVNFEIREDVIAITEDIEKAEAEADDAIEAYAVDVEVIQTDLVEEQRDRDTDNDNVVQRGVTVVDNINTEIIESDDENDLPRETYLLDVEEIRSEIILEDELESVDQTNATFNQKDYVEEYKENRIEEDPNMDVARKNTEIDVEDQNIRLINSNNSDIWEQEDGIMEVKDGVEDQIDIQTANHEADDIPRVEGVGLLEDVNDELDGVEQVNKDEQYDINVKQKEYTETIINEIEIENLANDIPRQDMEEFAEEQALENKETVNEYTESQDNVLYKADEVTEEIEITIEQNAKEDDLNREGYEETVEQIVEEQDGFIDDNQAEAEDDSYKTTDYVEKETNVRRDTDKDANDNAHEIIDNTSDLVDDMNEAENELDDKSRVDLEDSEDYVEKLRDINLKEIDEKMKNSLGDQFPEGVTEEIYTIEDEDGLMTAYVVRRVVVINGVGNVYEKTQTKFGTTTYTCNGNGITEYQWQDQTEAANLVRN